VTDFNRLEYEKRVNTVIDYIREHLSGELSLAELARVAAFSPFHFHRVFKALTDETLFRRPHEPARSERARGGAGSRVLLRRHLRTSLQGLFRHERDPVERGRGRSLA